MDANGVFDDQAIINDGVRGDLIGCMIDMGNHHLDIVGRYVMLALLVHRQPITQQVLQCTLQYMYGLKRAQQRPVNRWREVDQAFDMLYLLLLRMSDTHGRCVTMI